MPEKQESVASVGMTVRIDPKEISKAVADAVMASEIGPLVKKAVMSTINERKNWGSTCIEAAVQEKILEIVKEMVVRDMSIIIEVKVKEVMVQERFVDKAVESAVKKLLYTITR